LITRQVGQLEEPVSPCEVAYCRKWESYCTGFHDQMESNRVADNHRHSTMNLFDDDDSNGDVMNDENEADRNDHCRIDSDG
jgi:hypothetical protein